MRTNVYFKFFLFIFILTRFLPLARGQQAPRVIGETKHDLSAPMWQLNPGFMVRHPQPATSQWPNQNLAGRTATTQGLNFDGIGASKYRLAPDTSGAVGATQYVQSVNTRYAVYDKSNGSLLYGPASLNSIWRGFGGDCETRNDGDPIVEYDKIAGRWIVSRHTVPPGGPFLQCVAVSQTSDAMGSFYRYAFQLTTDWPDYPKLAVWPDAYYLSIDRASSSFANLGGLICALDRNAMIAGAAAMAQCFETGVTLMGLLASNFDGSALPPAGSPNYVLDLGTNALNLWNFHVDFQNPGNTTFTGPTSIAVAPFTQTCPQRRAVCIPQLDTAEVVDSVSDRLMSHVAYRNFGDHESLVVTHTVAPRAHTRWYEIRSPGGTPVVFQQGTPSPDGNFRWLGSIGMDKVGNIAIGYSVSSASMHPGINYTSRVPTDPLGTLEPEAVIRAGGGSQQFNNSMWNDVSTLSIDPVDDCTFWYSNEYYPSDSAGYWHTRIASFKLNTCQ